MKKINLGRLDENQILIKKTSIQYNIVKSKIMKIVDKNMKFTYMRQSRLSGGKKAILKVVITL